MTCKVCSSHLQTDIDNKILSGCSYREVSKWCAERGFKVSTTTIRNHAINHLESRQKSEVKNIDTKDNLNLINFENYCEKLGLTANDFENLEDNLDRVIYASQKAITLLFFKNTAVVDRKLTVNLDDFGSYPTEEIKGLRLIFDMYTKIIGVDIMIDENRAIKLLESMGYEISKNPKNITND